MPNKTNPIPKCPKCKTLDYVVADDGGEDTGRKFGAAIGGIGGAGAVGLGLIEGASFGAVLGSVVPGIGNLVGGAGGAIVGAIVGGIGGAVSGGKIGEYIGSHFDHGYRCTSCGWHSDATPKA